MIIPEVLISQLILGVIFLRAGFSKAFSLRETELHIQDYQLLSGSQAKVVAYVLPFIEIFVGVSCIAGMILPISSILAAFVLFIFCLAIFINLIRGRRFQCHCFGSSKTPIGIPVLLRNLILIILALFLVQQSFSYTYLVSWWQVEFGSLTHVDILIPVVMSIAIISGIIAILDGVSLLL